MPAPLTGYVSGLLTAYLWVGTNLNTLSNQTLALSNALTAEGCPASGIAAGNMKVAIDNLRTWLSWGGSSMQHFDILALDWIDSNWPNGGGAVDMDAILSAMWSSKNWQTLLFIAYIDAMRGSISEKTVTQQSMADYLRHFL